MEYFSATFAALTSTLAASGVSWVRLYGPSGSILDGQTLKSSFLLSKTTLFEKTPKSLPGSIWGCFWSTFRSPGASFSRFCTHLESKWCPAGSPWCSICSLFPYFSVLFPTLAPRVCPRWSPDALWTPKVTKKAPKNANILHRFLLAL